MGTWHDISVTTTQPMAGPWLRVALRGCRVGSITLWQVGVLYEGEQEETTKEFTLFGSAGDYYEGMR
jgi:hypothetical protein